LAAASANFGFLEPHEPLLVWYGAGAEALVYVDAQAAIVKTRQFAEALAKELVRRTGTPVSDRRRLASHINALHGAGVLAPNTYAAFERLRQQGNDAVHGELDELQTALELLRTCFELGVWFHRALSGDRRPIGFVPPSPPPQMVAQTDCEALRDTVARYRDELAATRLLLAGRATLAEAETAARADADRAVRTADQARASAQTLLEQLEPAAAEAERELDARRSVKVSAARREEFIARARQASREPLNEVETRREIDRQLVAAGWVVQDEHRANLYAGLGVALREVRLAAGRVDYLLYVGARLAGVVEAKREGTAPRGVEAQLDRYLHGLTAEQRFAAWRRDLPLPFGYVATGVETAFVNQLDPHPRTREVFAFHRPETLARWMREADERPEAPTLRARLQRMPVLDPDGLRPAQADAIRNLERSLGEDRPRGLIQMATGAGKTFTAVTASYRLLKHAKVNRILFLVDRNNLGKQTWREYAAFRPVDDGRKFTELYNVDRLSGAGMLDGSKVVISTIQRLYGVLRGQELPDVDLDDQALDSYDLDEPAEVVYNPAIPPATFDLIIVDECHRSIYGKWRAVLEYFDAHILGLTATPVKQTLGFFQQNMISEYAYEEAVADGVNVDFDIYRIKTETTQAGAAPPRHPGATPPARAAGSTASRDHTRPRTTARARSMRRSAAASMPSSVRHTVAGAATGPSASPW
jgi:type I restriction enzyme R subunit